MNTQDLAGRKVRAESEPLIIARVENGFRVHAPEVPAKAYIVSGSPDEPTCTCPDFQVHEGDPAWCCKHILAVEARFGSPSEEESDPIATEERRAIQEEERAPSPSRRGRPPKSAEGASHMLLKRSISPDGRIDSLSVEFSCPVDKITAAEIEENAGKIVKLQDRVIRHFLQGRKHETAPVTSNGNGAPRPPNGSDAAVPAQIRSVGGMNGKWGRRLFLNVQVNGDSLKLFGNRSQLAEALESAGYLDFGEITENLQINLPCRVITKPTPDGRYTNIERVLPAERESFQRRSR